MKPPRTIVIVLVVWLLAGCSRNSVSIGSPSSNTTVNSSSTDRNGSGTAPNVNAENQNCDPNYEGACVPIASDVDCAGGSGNGPAYVQGPLKVIGKDIYGLEIETETESHANRASTGGMRRENFSARG